MKWPFFKQWAEEKSRCQNTVDVKRKQKRHTKTRLINLLCTLKQRPVSMDLSVNGFPSMLKQMPIKKNEIDSNRPPVLRSSTKRPATTHNSPSAFCPSCHQVMILLPQKRSTQDSLEPQFAKRMRSSLVSYRWEPVNYHNSQLNPTYDEYAQSDNLGSFGEDDSIYSEVASISSSSSSINNTYDDICRRPKLVGVRRRDSFQGCNSQWLVGNSSSITSDLAESEPIYATMLPDDEEFTVGSSTSHESVFEQPWSSSTLKKSAKFLDIQTIYDKVASDDEEEEQELDSNLKWIEQLENVGTIALDITHRRRRQAPVYLDHHVKLARREYYICEE